MAKAHNELNEINSESGFTICSNLLLWWFGVFRFFFYINVHSSGKSRIENNFICVWMHKKKVIQYRFEDAIDWIILRIFHRRKRISNTNFQLIESKLKIYSYKMAPNDDFFSLEFVVSWWARWKKNSTNVIQLRNCMCVGTFRLGAKPPWLQWW